MLQHLLSRRGRMQGLLLLGLIVFTFINLVPILWGFLISIKQPADAFSIPPKLIFDADAGYSTTRSGSSAASWASC